MRIRKIARPGYDNDPGIVAGHVGIGNYHTWPRQSNKRYRMLPPALEITEQCGPLYIPRHGNPQIADTLQSSFDGHSPRGHLCLCPPHKKLCNTKSKLYWPMVRSISIPLHVSSTPPSGCTPIWATIPNNKFRKCPDGVLQPKPRQAFWHPKLPPPRHPCPPDPPQEFAIHRMATKVMLRD